MKIIYSIIISFLLISTTLWAETNKFDFAESKQVHEQAGAWTSKAVQMYFFEDGTVLYISFGETGVGHWKFLNKEKTKIKYSQIVSKGRIYSNVAEIDGDKLIEDQGDYESYYTRIQKEKTY